MNRVRIRRVAKFLDRPHRHVIVRIEAGVGVIAPAIDRIIARIARVVGGTGRGVEQRCSQRAGRVILQPAGGSRVHEFIDAGGKDLSLPSR